jgi:holliday junction DNA helicase RuvA
MIARLTGTLLVKDPVSVIIDVHGVGYRASIPLSTFYGLPDIGNQISLHIHTHVREDAILLYGFLTLKEKELFLALTAVSGIGPKVALAIISGLPAGELADAIARGDQKKISTIPGVGPKTAARVVLELKDKVGALGAAESGPCTVGTPSRQRDEAVSALVNLGYKKNMAEDAVKKICAAGGEDMALEALIKEALKALSR